MTTRAHARSVKTSIYECCEVIIGCMLITSGILHKPSLAVRY